MVNVSVDAPWLKSGSGQANRAERDAHFFPLKVSQISPIRLARLQQAFALMNRTSPVPGNDYAILLEGAVALRLALISGRTLEEIHELKASPECSALDPDWPTPSLVRVKGYEPALWLKAGQAPHPAGHKLASRHAGQFSNAVWLGVDHLSQDLLSKYRPKPVLMLKGAAPSNWPKLFGSTPLDDLAKAIDRFRKWAAHELGFGQENSLPDIDRCSKFLERQLTVVAPGDPAASWLITNTVPARNATTSFYTAMSLSKALSFHRAAIECLADPEDDVGTAPRSAAPAPALLDDLTIGSRYCPVQSSLHALRDRLISGAHIGRGTLTAKRTSEIDHAFTAYCWLFFSLHTGWRPPQQLLPSLADIDLQAGAFMLEDKKMSGPVVAPQIHDTEHVLLDEITGEDVPASNGASPAASVTTLMSKRRWLPLGERVLAQLTAYHRHVAARAKRRLQEASFEHRDEVTACFRAMPGFGWDLPYNFTRHYLRSSLIGIASVEAINAYLGHWDAGAEPWWNGSCLDPFAYTSQLQWSIAQIFPPKDWPVLKGFQ